MTPTDYRLAIKAVGLPSQNAAGRFFGVTEVTGRRWASFGPPAPVAKFLRLMVALKFTAAYVEDVISDPL